MTKPSGTILNYLQAVVLMANEVIDFEAHNVMIYNRASQQFNRNWHFIEGFWPLKKKLTENQNRFLLKVLDGESAILKRQIIPADGMSEIKSDVIYAPMKIDDCPIGILYILPPDGQRFSKYDSHLMTCIISVVCTGFSRRTARKSKEDFLAPLQFSLLHRKHHLLAAKNANDVINHYFNSLVSQKESPIFSSKTGVISVNFRLAAREGSNITLPFAEPMKNVRAADSKRAQKRKLLRLTTKQIDDWINSWMVSDCDPFDDIDRGYHIVFPKVRSHIAVPCKYAGKLYGILSVDSDVENKFTAPVGQMLYIIGAQMASVVANAQARSEIVEKQAYLESVLNAIPDQITIIGEDARIQLMNKARQDKFRTANKGDLCYETFEEGENSPCKGCYTLTASETGESIKQALWEYTDPKTYKKSYVEISAGQLKNENGKPLQPRQAVEVVRDVNEREEMLKWMSEVQSHLLADNLPEILWEDIGGGLKRMGFERYKIYAYDRSCFVGKICSEKVFNGRYFTNISLNPDNDIPSKKLKSLYKINILKPVQFIVKKQGKKTPKREKEWNYITHYLKRIPPEYRTFFSMEGIQSWVEIPIGLPGTLFGKIVVEKKAEKISPDKSHSSEPNAYEMAILASFGKFVSVAMQTARQHAEQKESVVKSVQISARQKFAQYPKAILGLYESPTLLTNKRIELLNWAILLPIVSPDAFNISRAQHFLIKKEGKDTWIVTGAGIGARRLKGISLPTKKLHNELTKLFDAYPLNELDGNTVIEMSKELRRISFKITPRLADGCIGAITNEEISASKLDEAIKTGEPRIVEPSKDLSSLDMKFLEFAQGTERVKQPFVYVPITSPMLSITQQQGFLYLDNIFRKNSTISLDDANTIGAFVSILCGLYASEKTRWQFHMTLGAIGHAIKCICDSRDFEQEMALWQLDVLKSFLSPEKTIQIDKCKHLDTTTELKPVLNETIAFIKERAKIKKATVQIHEAPDVCVTDKFFKGSGMLLKVVLYQLLDNAVKFTSIADRHKKEVGIRIDCSNAKPGYIHLVVWDTGIGVNRYLMPRLGKEWYRSEQSEEGAGIGLITCYKLLEEWTGRSDNYDVKDNVVGEGSEFHIWIPRPTS